MDSIFVALAEPRRRHLVDLLREGPRAVGELAEATGLSQPNTSKHLRVLRDARVVVARVEGRRRLYEVRLDTLRELDAWLAPWRRLWSASLDRLEHALESSHPPPESDDE